MSKKIRHAPVPLDSQGITDLPLEEIATILRGADEIIMQGGRSLLAKILKGSKEVKLQELNLDQIAPFGTLSDLSLKEIHGRIDWLILMTTSLSNMSTAYPCWISPRVAGKSRNRH